MKRTISASHSLSLVADVKAYGFEDCQSFGEIADGFRALADAYEQLGRDGATIVEMDDPGWVEYEMPGHTVEVEVDDDGQPIGDDLGVGETLCPKCMS